MKFLHQYSKYYKRITFCRRMCEKFLNINPEINILSDSSLQVNISEDVVYNIKFPDETVEDFFIEVTISGVPNFTKIFKKNEFNLVVGYIISREIEMKLNFYFRNLGNET